MALDLKRLVSKAERKRVLDMAKFEELATKIGALVDEKNAAYGNSFEQAGEFLRLLYPQGITPDKYGDMLCVVRIFDKLKRIATKKDAFGESPFQDIVGYGLLGTERDNRIRERAEFLKEYRSDLIEKGYKEAEEKLAVLTAPQPTTYKKSPKDA